MTTVGGLLEGFSRQDVTVDGVRIATWVGGDGPPLLALHGYPQTHVMWHQVAPALAEDHTVVLTDLRGYGDSDKPAPTADHAPYAKRATAADQVGVMRHLGFERFDLAGHDRGARVAHRLVLDHPDAVRRLAVLDIVPTLHAVRSTDLAMARAYFHWFFLSQPAPLPETLILIVIALGYTRPGTPTGSPWSVTAHAAPAALTDSPHGRELESISTVVVTNRSSHIQRLHEFIIWMANPDGSSWTSLTTISLLCNDLDFPDFASGMTRRIYVADPGHSVRIVQAGRLVSHRDCVPGQRSGEPALPGGR